MVLTASPGTIADADGLAGVSYSYQWIRVDGADEMNIDRATSGTYTPVQADVGKTLTVRASFTDNAGNAEQRTSAPTATVIAANRAPAAADALVTTREDTSYTFAAGDFNFSDADGDALASVKITSVPTAGTLALDSATVTRNQAVSRADVDAGKLSFTPAANANGNAYASFTFKVNDGTDDSADEYTITLNVTAVNDPPTAADNTVATAEDTPYTFTAGDFNFSDADTGDALASVKIVSLPTAGTLALDSATVTTNRSVPKADIDGGRLRFTPAANASGNAYASFAFKVNDGTEDSAANYNMTINVTAANDPPTAADKTVTTAEDNAYTFTAGDFNFSDADTGDALASVKIVSLPTAGTLALDSATVTRNQQVLRADIAGGKLRFTPAANANGDAYANFAFKVNDGTEDSAANYNMTINVTAANDPPTAANSRVTTVEDTPYTFTTGDFNFSDPDGDDLASVKITSLPTAGTLTLDSTAVMTNQPVPKADIAGSKLRFTPASNASGDAYASFTFTVNDGTGDSAANYNMSINVTAANDPPTAAHNTVATAEDTPYTFTVGDFNFSDPDGDDLANVRIVSLPTAGTLALDSATVTTNKTVPRADIAGGKLRFTPAANANGNAYANFAFKVNDGTEDSAANYNMTLNVTAANDPPTAADNTVATAEDNAYIFTAGDFQLLRCRHR